MKRTRTKRSSKESRQETVAFEAKPEELARAVLRGGAAPRPETRPTGKQT